MDHQASSKINLTLPIYYFMNMIIMLQLTGTFFATFHRKGENDGVGGDVKNKVWCKTLQMKVLVTNLNEFVETAQKKFPSFVIVAFNSAEV